MRDHLCYDVSYEISLMAGDLSNWISTETVIVRIKLNLDGFFTNVYTL